MFAHSTKEVIESDKYGKAVFHAVDGNMEEKDFSMMGEVIQASWKQIRSQTIHNDQFEYYVKYLAT